MKNENLNKKSPTLEGTSFPLTSLEKLTTDPVEVDPINDYYFTPRYIVIPAADADTIKSLLTTPQKEDRTFHFEELPESFQTSISQDIYHKKFPVLWNNTKLTIDVIFSTSAKPIARFYLINTKTQEVLFTANTSIIQFDIPLSAAKIVSGITRYTTSPEGKPIQLHTSWLVYTEQDFSATVAERCKSFSEYWLDDTGIWHHLDSTKD